MNEITISFVEQAFEKYVQDNPLSDNEIKAAWHAFREGFFTGKKEEQKYWSQENKKLRDQIEMLSLDVAFYQDKKS